MQQKTKNVNLPRHTRIRHRKIPLGPFTCQLSLLICTQKRIRDLALSQTMGTKSRQIQCGGQRNTPGRRARQKEAIDVEVVSTGVHPVGLYQSCSKQSDAGHARPSRLWVELLGRRSVRSFRCSGRKLARSMDCYLGSNFWQSYNGMFVRACHSVVSSSEMENCMPSADHVPTATRPGGDSSLFDDLRFSASLRC